MIVFLVRHAHAIDERRDLPDAARPLSATGRAQARALGLRLRWHDCAPTALLTSPLVRAVMTAELIGAALAWPATIDCLPALAPDGRVGDVVAALTALDPASTVVLVGHEPSISALGARLTGDPDFPPLAKAQAVRLDGREVRWRFSHDDDAPAQP
ncbi:MAG: phosphoglycerate mutase family protein [Kofleriaceae bacterium]